MGNICGTPGSHYVYSPPVSPRHVSGSSTPVRSVGGQGLTSVYQLSAEARDDFLDRFDPMRSLGLNSETPLYRTTERTYLRGGKLAGNPESCARIGLHEELAPNPYAQHYGIPEGDSNAYKPRVIPASDLRVPSLNVMVGSEAREAVRHYASENHVAVEMRLGDFLEKGGKVYSDVSAVHDNGDTASSLIVTLPRGRKVSAQIVSD
ncbi:type III effector HopF2 [Pseudomonas amygdali pv. aesculi str. 0893_23]|uniref:AvrPphF family type III effector n=1 Tax=Pseudomonas syringae group genomosp. 2 TaxID=251698 RepID=UPI0001CC41D1|nr:MULTISPECIES: AvrPphF family type III effector [Pseudomonas syringae group genomosp. 2]EGH05304.1 type III effector HopF2 [Pseudomonas amygdali pv. aesculi str. 0893_23]KPW23975.1 hypothetical protein ALO90_200059 [Pseudomonas amygdali pv. aesculi]MCQ3013577.1 AvrPphF family type III effector [Pseudomonas savastanoi]